MHGAKHLHVQQLPEQRLLRSDTIEAYDYEDELFMQ